MEHEDCLFYTIDALQPGDFVDCDSNGHYLCAECSHRKKCFCGDPAIPCADKCEKCEEVLFRLFDC